MTHTDAMAREICAAKCAAIGDPPCWREDIAGDDAVKRCPDKPSCDELAKATLAKVQRGG